MGLHNCGEKDPARTTACRWLENVPRAYSSTGKLVEKCDVAELYPDC